MSNGKIVWSKMVQIGHIQCAVVHLAIRFLAFFIFLINYIYLDHSKSKTKFRPENDKRPSNWTSKYGPYFLNTLYPFLRVDFYLKVVRLLKLNKLKKKLAQSVRKITSYGHSNM